MRRRRPPSRAASRRWRRRDAAQAAVVPGRQPGRRGRPGAAPSRHRGSPRLPAHPPGTARRGTARAPARRPASGARSCGGLRRGGSASPAPVLLALLMLLFGLLGAAVAHRIWGPSGAAAAAEPHRDGRFTPARAPVDGMIDDDAPAPRTHDDSEGPVVVDDAPRILGGRYEVGELIGRGGMAEVHIGHDTRLGRTVAIKILRSDLARDPSFQARFRREAQAAASLNHPAVVAVYDTGEDVTHRARRRASRTCRSSSWSTSRATPCATSCATARPCRSTRPSRSPPACCPRSSTPTGPASCTGTSSRPTSCSPRPARSR